MQDMYAGMKKPKRQRTDFSVFPPVTGKNNGVGQTEFNIIGVNYNDSLEDVRKFASEFNLTMPLVLGGGGEDSVSKMYGVKAYPSNYIVDSEGTVISTYVGFDEEGIRADLNLQAAKD